MEAGYDYTLMDKKSLRERMALPVAVALALAVGLLGISGYLYGQPLEAKAGNTQVAVVGAGADEAAPPAARRQSPEEIWQGYANGDNAAATSEIAEQRLFIRGAPNPIDWINPLGYQP